MEVTVMSRRSLVAAGAYSWVGSVLLPVVGGARATQVSATANEQLIRAYYAGWEKKDWSVLDGFLADSFTFSSAAGDDHISKSAFKKQCWDTQANSIDRMELESLLTSAKGGDAFVKYLCHTKKGTAFRNVEYFRIADSKIDSIECYFGGNSGYPSASDASKT